MAWLLRSITSRLEVMKMAAAAVAVAVAMWMPMELGLTALTVTALPPGTLLRLAAAVGSWRRSSPQSSAKSGAGAR